MTALYQRAIAAHAAEVDPASLTQWIKRGLPILDPYRGDFVGDGPGFHHLFSVGTIKMVAILGRLSAIGIPLHIAWRAADLFLAPGETGTRRPAGELIPWGRTFLIVNAAGDAKIAPGIVTPPDGGALAVLELNGVLKRVAARLGTE